MKKGNQLEGGRVRVVLDGERLAAMVLAELIGLDLQGVTATRRQCPTYTQVPEALCGRRRGPFPRRATMAGQIEHWQASAWFCCGPDMLVSSSHMEVFLDRAV
jgi:hypothetical protein